MATHPLQSTGQISMNDINLELGRASGSQISLDDAEGGLYGVINLLSASKPSPTNPATISEWYGYNHLATDVIAPTIPGSFTFYNPQGGPFIDYDGDGNFDYGVSWTASTDNVAVTGYEVYVTRNGVYATSLTTTSLGMQLFLSLESTYGTGTFCFKARAYDAAGNYSGFTSESCVYWDFTAPTAPTGVATSSVTETTLTLSWNASTDISGVTAYLVYKNGVLLTTLGNVLTTPITGLTAYTAYAFTVKARDGYNNLSAVSNTANVTTLDSTAPTAPTSLAASAITQTTCTLNWAASSDNVAVTNYLVYKNGVLSLTLGNVLTTGISGLTASTAYSFTVYAKDAAGNTSSVSNTASFTTLAANQPPTTPTTFTVTRGTLQATIAWSGATDDVAVTNYEIHRSLDGTSYSFLTYDSVSPYVNTGLASGSTYWYKVRSIDGGGLMSAFTTPKSVTII